MYRGPSSRTKDLLYYLANVGIDQMIWIRGDDFTIKHTTMVIKEVNNKKRGYKDPAIKELIGGKRFRTITQRSDTSWQSTIYIVRVK